MDEKFACIEKKSYLCHAFDNKHRFETKVYVIIYQLAKNAPLCLAIYIAIHMYF